MKKSNVVEFEQVIERGCGIDIHKSVLVVTVRGIKVTDEEKKSINIERDDFHGEWNYCIKPNL